MVRVNPLRAGRVATPLAVSEDRADVPAAILFDLDGTLVDTMQSFADLAADVMHKHHGTERALARRQYLRTSGVPFCEQLVVIFGDHPANARAADEFERRKHALAVAAEMEPATRAALEALQARGIALIVSSNGMQQHVDHFAARADGLFALALGFDGGRGKGEPHIREVTERLGIDRTQMTFVGDSIRDGELAAEAGVRFIGRVGTFSSHDLRARFPEAALVEHVAELPQIV